MMRERESVSFTSSSEETISSTSELNETLEPVDYDNIFLRDVIIDQYANDVIDFSSQYGSDLSISYTALNITGRPSKYPDYGDFPETFAMRTYGTWWETAPSKVSEINPQNFPKIQAQDFIVLKFEQYVIPEKLIIYETYNPGAIVRIWSYSINKQWFCLWESPPCFCKNAARKFMPSIKKMSLPTSIIRLEFDHSGLDYFTEIDGVTLIGKACNSFTNPEVSYDYLRHHNWKGPISRKLESIKFRPCIKENYQDYIQKFLVRDLEKFISEAGLLPIEKETENDNTQLSLKDMPYEILLNIFSYLDLKSLFHVGRVSKLMYEVSTHSLLYCEINLMPYWHLTSSELINSLTKRAQLLKKLDISWCGLFNSVSSTEFKTFIQTCGKSLTHLKMNSCEFLNASCLETVGDVCVNLKELSLRNYISYAPMISFRLADLKNLERLDLSRTLMETDLLLLILKNNPKLKHLNLAFSGIHINMDDIALHIAKYNRELISLDMWKSHSLSSIGLHALSMCHNLEEVDFGWCLREEATPSESLKSLLKGCPNLKKLFLAAIRSISDHDLENIANLCPNLEQLDLMGVLGISTEKCHEILQKCKHLKLFDLNFVDHLDESQINYWRNKYNVNIKRSFVPSHDFLN